MRYSDEFRASALVMLRANDYPNRKGALSETAKYLGISHQLLGTWYRRDLNPPPQKILQVKIEDIVEMLKTEVARAIQAMPYALPDADYLDIGKVAGILIDKLQLLSGEATERIKYELSDSDRSEQIVTLLDRARERATRLPSDGHETIH